ncbi:MAG: right-handed parallel beta-helix repeat-containing protein [Caldilineaceae bacterium]
MIFNKRVRYWPFVTLLFAIVYLLPAHYPLYAHPLAHPMLTEVGGDITINTTWTKANSPYIVTSNVAVATGVILTIEPGVIVKFGGSQQLTLADNAQLQAVGTQAEPIVFTSNKDDSYGGDTNGDGQATLPVAGNWYYLWGSGANSTLHLEHALVRYSVYGVYANANLTLRDSTIEESSSALVYVNPTANTTPTVVIERNTLRDARYYGLELREIAGNLTVNNNTIVDTGQIGAFVYNVSNAQIDHNTLTFTTGNPIGFHLESLGAAVAVTNNTITYSGPQSTQHGIEVITSSPQLTNNQVHGFEKAVLINGGYPQQAPTYSGNDFSGNTLDGIGIAGEILAGAWTKIGGYTHFIDNSATIANGATFTFSPGDVVKFGQYGSLQLGTGATLQAIGTANNPIVFTSMKDDTYGGDTNQDSQATLPAPGDWYYLYGAGPASTIQLQHVLVRFGGGGVIYSNSNLTLQDSTIERSSQGVYVQPANNTPSSNILIERNTFNKNIGRSIQIYEQPTSLSIRENSFTDNERGIELYKLTDAQIMSNTFTFTTIYATGIAMEDVGAGVAVAHNQLTHSGDQSTEAGFELKNSTPQLTGNRVAGFEEAVLISAGYPQQVPTYSDNIFANNQYRDIGVTGQLLGGTWSETAGYRHFIAGYTTLANGATLTIPPGAVVKFAPSAQLFIGTGATLNAVGTTAEQIVFTSISDDSYGDDANGDGQASAPDGGDWYGIHASGIASNVVMQYVLVRYAGYALEINHNLTLQDSIVEENSNAAIYILGNNDGDPTVTIERTLIRNNGSDGVYVAKMPTTLTFNDNALINNQSYAFRSTDSSATVNAIGNWWGSAAGPTANTEENLVSDNVNYSDWLTNEPTYVPLERPRPTANTPAASPDRYETDNSCVQANGLAVDEAFQEHTFHAAGDADWLKFTTASGETYRIEVQPQTDSLADVNLELYTQCDTPPADRWQATFTPGVRLDFQATQAGTIYLKLTNYDAAVYGANTGYRVSVRQRRATSEPGALIIMAGRLKGTDQLQANIHNVTTEVYQLFKANGYSDDLIQYLATDNTLPGWDANATLANLQNAITSWAVDKVGADKPLTIYMMDHGGIDTFYVDGSNNQLSPDTLDGWLSQLQAAAPQVRINVIIEACHSGSFIEGAKRISKAGRMIISSTNVQNVAYASTNGAHFSDRLITSLREGYSLYNSFWDAQKAVRSLNTVQEPWIDTNGNGIPNEEADGADVSRYNPNVDQGPADSWAPYIVTAQGPDQIVDNQGNVRAEVRDNKSVKRVWAAIYPPSYEAPTSADELVPEDVTIRDFTAQGNNLYSLDYDNFSEEGSYQVALFAEDNDGLKARLMVLTVHNGDSGAIYLPLIMR